MFLLDDVILFPMTGLLWVVKEIHAAAQQNIESMADSITRQLSALYMNLETGKITEEEFDEQEKELLNVLDEIQERSSLVESMT